MNNLSEIINKIATVNSKISLNRLFTEINDRYNYQWGGLMVITPISVNDHSTSTFGNIPSAVIDHIQQHTHILRYCMNEDKPINYRAILGVNESGSECFTDDNFELVIPIKGRGTEFACLIFSIPDKVLHSGLIDKIGWYWLIPSTFIYSCYREFISNSPIQITQREQECIKWASEGKTSWEISQILTISKSTVDFHLANCIEKTGSANRQQAIVKCLFNGQLLTF